MSKFKDLIEEARKPEVQKAVNTEKNLKDSAIEATANLTIKVPIKLRRHWMSQAKARGLTLTKVITEALSKEFG